MSEKFYNYISKTIINYFNSINVMPGNRFNIEFENDIQVESLYNSFKNSQLTNTFISSKHQYETCCIESNGVKIIIAATINNITDGFLTFLRNKVGTSDPKYSEFAKTAILFIHNSSLDSIIKGATSFQKLGMPLHVDSIVKDITQKLKTSQLCTQEKTILNFLLKKKEEEIFESNTSFFEYQEILESIGCKSLDKSRFKGFRLFYDSELYDFKNVNQLEKRLEENFSRFSDVDSIHKYGNPEEQLEKSFDDKGVNQLSQPNWYTTEYEEVRKSYENKKNTRKLEYIQNKKNFSLEGMPYWERPEGESSSKSRIRNIIVFNTENYEEITMEFAFNDSIGKENIKSVNSENHSAVTSGKKIRVTIKCKVGETVFCEVRCQENSLKFIFRIAVVECDEVVLKGIETNYSVYPKQNIIVSNTDNYNLTINPKGMNTSEKEIACNNCMFEILDSTESLNLIKNIDDSLTEEELIRFNIKYINTLLPLAIKQELIKPEPITGIKMWRLKIESQKSFEYIDENKFVHSNKEYFAKEHFRKNIEKEMQIVTEGGLFYKQRSENLIEEKLEIDESLKEAYHKLIEYYRANDLCPSLAYMSERLMLLSKNYVEIYYGLLCKLEETILEKKESNLIKIGTIEVEDENKEIIFTPFHPLNIAYQIFFHEKYINNRITEPISKRFGSYYLIPYIYNDNQSIYKVQEQPHSPEWNYYVDNKTPKYKGAKNYVPDLVHEKIKEFVVHFSYLFELSYQSPIKINLINLGDCKEILQGIFLYYMKSLKDNKYKKDALYPIELHIYSEKTSNVFEELSSYDDPELIEETFQVNLETDYYDKKDILDTFRQKVKFYLKSSKTDNYEYSHITFYQMEGTAKSSYSKMNEITTGISLDGLLSGVSSVFTQNTYRTGFGTKHINKNTNFLLNLSIKLNALARAANQAHAYKEDECIITAITKENKSLLNKIYDSSHWITFIDPKVGLNFFKGDTFAKDLLIIHYSDQYTTSSGYDAITVTRRSEQYCTIIDEFIKEKGISNHESHPPYIVNFFNAVNGDWLLRLISKSENFSREKISILSAVKVCLSYLYHKNITWIPVSLEEILRISGATGLSKNDGIFTAKNLGVNGKHCDDLLLVGIEQIGEKVKVHYYPVEVKIGLNPSSVLNNAVVQAKKTRELIENNLTNKSVEVDGSKDNLSQSIYRNFLIQIAIISAEKLKLYEIWKEQDWDKVLDSDIRRKLLNDEYEISYDLDSYIGKGGVISFKTDTYFRTSKIEDNFLILQMTENDAYDYLIKDIEDIKKYFIESPVTGFDKDYMLHFQYNNNESLTTQANETPSKSSETIGSTNKIEENTESTQVKEFSKPLEILFGQNAENQKPVYWYPTDTNKVSHTNTGIIGTMGTGKTQFTKSLITQLHLNQNNNVNSTPIGILIFDYKGDYIKDDFVKATNARVYDLYHLPYNPLSLFLTETTKNLLPLHTANNLKETIATAFNLGIKQKTFLKDVIMETYEKRSIYKNLPETWNKLSPTIHDVYNNYIDKEGIKEDSLYAAFTELIDFEIFEPDCTKTKSLNEIIDGVTVINLSGPYSDNIQNLVVAITLDIFYSQMQMGGHSTIAGNYREITKMILVDEADNFLIKNFNSLRKILKEGREFGVGTILSTQFLSHFSTSDNEYANYILTWIVHKVSEISSKDVKFIFNTQSKGEEDNIINRIKKLEKHYSIVNLGGASMPVHIRDRAFWEIVNNINN